MAREAREPIVSSASRIAPQSLSSAFPFNQPLLTKSRAASVRKSPPERERSHFKVTLRHPSSSRSCFQESNRVWWSLPKPPPRSSSICCLLVFCLIAGCSADPLHPAALPSSSWGGSICCKAEWDIQSNPSSESWVSPLSCWNGSRRRTPHQRPGPAQLYSELHLEVSACP